MKCPRHQRGHCIVRDLGESNPPPTHPAAILNRQFPIEIHGYATGRRAVIIWLMPESIHRYFACIP